MIGSACQSNNITIYIFKVSVLFWLIIICHINHIAAQLTVYKYMGKLIYCQNHHSRLQVTKLYHAAHNFANWFSYGFSSLSSFIFIYIHISVILYELFSLILAFEKCEMMVLLAKCHCFSKGSGEYTIKSQIGWHVSRKMVNSIRK